MNFRGHFQGHAAGWNGESCFPVDNEPQINIAACGEDNIAASTLDSGAYNTSAPFLTGITPVSADMNFRGHFQGHTAGWNGESCFPVDNEPQSNIAGKRQTKNMNTTRRKQQGEGTRRQQAINHPGRHSDMDPNITAALQRERESLRKTRAGIQSANREIDCFRNTCKATLEEINCIRARGAENVEERMLLLLGKKMEKEWMMTPSAAASSTAAGGYHSEEGPDN